MIVHNILILEYLINDKTILFQYSILRDVFTWNFLYNICKSTLFLTIIEWFITQYTELNWIEQNIIVEDNLDQICEELIASHNF